MQILVQCPVRAIKARVHILGKKEAWRLVLKQWWHWRSKIFFEHFSQLLSPISPCLTPRSLLHNVRVFKWCFSLTFSCHITHSCICRQCTNMVLIMQLWVRLSLHIFGLWFYAKGPVHTELVCGAYFAFWLSNITPRCSTDWVTFKPLFHWLPAFLIPKPQIILLLEITFLQKQRGKPKCQ